MGYPVYLIFNNPKNLSKNLKRMNQIVQKSIKIKTRLDPIKSNIMVNMTLMDVFSKYS